MFINLYFFLVNAQSQEEMKMWREKQQELVSQPESEQLRKHKEAHIFKYVHSSFFEYSMNWVLEKL